MIDCYYGRSVVVIVRITNSVVVVFGLLRLLLALSLVEFDLISEENASLLRG